MLDGGGEHEGQKVLCGPLLQSFCFSQMRNKDIRNEAKFKYEDERKKPTSSVP